MIQCKIQWVDRKGRVTPDTNPAVALIRPHFQHFQEKACETMMKGLKCECPYTPDTRGYIPVCEDHLRRFELSHPRWNWDVIPLSDAL